MVAGRASRRKMAVEYNRQTSASSGLSPKPKNSMFQYTVDDLIELPLQTSVEVTIAFPTGKRWLFFATPELLNRVGDPRCASTVKLTAPKLLSKLRKQRSLPVFIAGKNDYALMHQVPDRIVDRKTSRWGSSSLPVSAPTGVQPLTSNFLDCASLKIR